MPSRICGSSLFDTLSWHAIGWSILQEPSTTDALYSILDADNESARERAWNGFLREYHDVLMHAARTLGGDHDAVMDRYTFVLDALRRDDFLRLRGYVASPRGRFSTWLIVVARRLCLDEYRHRHGRLQGESQASRDQRRERRNLTDLVGNELELQALEASPDDSPEALLRRSELQAALAAALAALNPSDRLLLRLRFAEDLSVPEIARVLGKRSPFPLYYRLDKVLSTLRVALQSVGMTDPLP